VQTPIHAPTPVLRRVWSLVAGSVLAMWVGAVLATVLGFGIAWAVITLTQMLKQ
jgi:purine-cytosine permease-like protein